MSSVPELRVRALNRREARGEGRYVLYWMIGSRRLHWNYALDRAVEHAARLGKPLLILEAIEVDYPWASDRHHRAILDGMDEHRHRLESTNVAYYPYVEPEPGAGRGLVTTLAADACVLVTDETPAFFLPSLIGTVGGSVPCLAEAVDGCGLLPLRATGRTFSAAYHFRRFLQRELLEHLQHQPAPEPLAGTPIPPLSAVPEGVASRWPMADESLLSDRAATSRLPIDHGVGPTGWVGGHTAARRRLDAFLTADLPRYGDERNDPDARAASRLSAWLHYGHISVHEVFDALARAESWSPARVSERVDGRREGWWGMSPSAESFLDELVTWRELGFSFCYREREPARFESLPPWALDTLELHASDPREYVYDASAFEAAATHDELWNAAQRQLVEDGVIHNYLRMLWGKKILEWTEHPRDALDIMIDLNNRYALDGRDPNSYTGIMWVLGRFDRPWPERPVYGKVRAMTSASTRRKVRVLSYLERWGSDGAQLSPTAGEGLPRSGQLGG